ncbi:NAD(P)H-flavin reductase [Nitrincola alkalilacustris]|uniref:NAD(P)H-flavin reductase n=1 Tax=Nitrincola alkalilacustris TaxID=1571224 RepID=UPI00124D09E8|nr:NAD(P)H-flavin reductase [Nitrincola alkalilacustris]
MNKRLTDIVAVERLNRDVFRITLSLVASDTDSLDFCAGQYLDLSLPDGKKASFSIASAPDLGRTLELHIRHMPGSVINEGILDHLQTQQQVEITLPMGSCFLKACDIADESAHLVFAAASTGFAQTKSMVEHLLANGISNPIDVYWGARVEEDMYLENLAKQWAERHANLRFIPVVSEPSKSPGWTGRTGLLPDAISEDLTSVDNVQLFASGSPAMVYALLDRFEARGLKPQQIHSDVFAYAPRP